MHMFQMQLGRSQFCMSKGELEATIFTPEFPNLHLKSPEGSMAEGKQVVQTLRLKVETKVFRVCSRDSLMPVSSTGSVLCSTW